MYIWGQTQLLTHFSTHVICSAALSVDVHIIRAAAGTRVLSFHHPARPKINIQQTCLERGKNAEREAI